MPAAQPPKGLDSPVTAGIIKWMARLNTAAFRLTNGRVGGRFRIGAGFAKPVPVLLLDHRGRRSGRTFTTPLLMLRDGEDYVVVASQGGLPGNPQWYYNLAADPDTTISVRGRRGIRVRAAEATPDERAALWPRLVDLYADFDKYQSWTDRTIPVIRLRPASPLRMT
jgi:deazaflavin-dependent oxidoreductase (nitroreductase family)